MNVTMRLTLDGMLRALRWRAHSVAEELSLIRAEAPRRTQPTRRAPRPAKPSKEKPDGQPRR